MALLSGALVAAALLSHREAFSNQLALLLSYQAPGLRRWGESHVSTFLFQVHPFLTAAALFSIGLAVKRRDFKYVIVLWPVLVLLVLKVERIRYWIPVFPMLALMGAFGLQAIESRELRNTILTCAVVSSLVVALYGFLPFLQKMSAANVQAAGEYLDSLAERRVDVYTLSSDGSEVNPAVTVPLLDLFTAKEVVHVDEGEPRPPTGVETSALRFTWAYSDPAYYSADPATSKDAAIVVVSQESDQPLPEPIESRLRGYRLDRTFAVHEGLFQYRTLIDVYRPLP
jgi:hypothetical protein